MTWGNSKPDQALLCFLETDLINVGIARNEAIKDLETLALRMAQAGMLDEYDADRVGRALRKVGNALDVVFKWLSFFRNSRPGEARVMEIGQGEETALLIEIQPRADGVVLNRMLKTFRRLHNQSPTQIAVSDRSMLPQALARAALGRLEIVVDDAVKPGRARLQ